MNNISIEKKSLKLTAIFNVIWAIAGWITYNLSGSYAVLLDANISFVMMLASLISIYISGIKHKKSVIFPYGNYAYEVTYILIKVLVGLSIILAAVLQSSLGIINFFQGKKVDTILIEPIYYYTVFVLIMMFSFIIYLRAQNKKTGYKNGLISVEEASIKIDGFYTLGTGLSFFFISFINVGSSLEFLKYIGDALIVIVLSITIIKGRLRIIKNNFIELSGGSIQNRETKELIEGVISRIVSNKLLYHTFISKVGSGYLVVIYLDEGLEIVDINELRKIQKDVKTRLQHEYPTVKVELALKDNL